MGHSGAISTVHTEGTGSQSDGTHWDTIYCTYRGHCQPAGEVSWLGTEDRQPDRQGSHTMGHTGELSTVHTEDINHQSDRGNTVRHTGAADHTATVRRPYGDRAIVHVVRLQSTALQFLNKV